MGGEKEESKYHFLWTAKFASSQWTCNYSGWKPLKDSWACTSGAGEIWLLFDQKRLVRSIHLLSTFVCCQLQLQVLVGLRFWYMELAYTWLDHKLAIRRCEIWDHELVFLCQQFKKTMNWRKSINVRVEKAENLSNNHQRLQRRHMQMHNAHMQRRLRSCSSLMMYIF